MADIENFNTASIAQHLKKGPFAPIFDQSTEKDDHVALKLMCIIDYYVQRSHLYASMQEVGPKLLRQLMQFWSYGSFKYYDYHVGTKIGHNVLKCKFCELIGPYGLILTHMAINHNAHIGLKVCNYCNSVDLKDHFDQNNLKNCYENYIERNDIEVNEYVFNIVTDFYTILKKLSGKLNIKTIRYHSFGGKGYGTVQRLDRGYDSDIDENILLYKSRTPNNTISRHLTELNGEFQNAIISNLYDGNNASRLIQPMNTDDTEAIAISDDDEDDDEVENGVDGSSNMSAAAANTCIFFKTENTSGEGTSTMHSADADADEHRSMTLQMPIKFEPEAVVTSQIKRTNDSDPFLQFVAQRLDEIPAFKRRKLENTILEAIVLAAK